MTKYDTQTIENTFRMYSTGIPVEQVAKEIGISKSTLYQWMKKYDWTKRSKKVQENALIQSNETLTEIKQRQHLILKGIMGRFMEQLRDGEVYVTPADLMAALKYEMTLFEEVSEPEENAYKRLTNEISELYKKHYGDSENETKESQNEY
jgi:transposase-like protein